MDRYYSDAAYAISEYLNAFGMEMNRTIPIYQHEWWSIFNDALYNTLKDYYKKNKIIIQLTPIEKQWLIRRNLLRGSVYELTDEDILIYDIVDTIEYYNYRWKNSFKNYM